MNAIVDMRCLQMVKLGVIVAMLLVFLSGCVSFEVVSQPKNWVAVKSEPVTTFDGDHNAVSVFDSKSFSFVTTVPSGAPPFMKVFDDIFVDEREGKIFLVMELRRNTDFDVNIETGYIVQYEKNSVTFFDDSGVDVFDKTFFKCYFYQGEAREYDKEGVCIIMPHVLVVDE
jgi:hypothetical protein